MFKLRPFKEADILKMIEQPENVALKGLAQKGLYKWAEQAGAFSGELNGQVVVCGGVTPYWPGRGQIWCMFDEDCRDCFVPVFRGIKIYLEKELKNYRRIELSTPVDHDIGRRRAELLGFKLEVEFAKNYMPDGSTASLYSLIRREG